MQANDRYPILNIRSSNELAKQIENERLPYKVALQLINDVKNNFDDYWHDNSEMSEPDKDKYVRSAFGNPLGKLLNLIDKKVLTPHDDKVPYFIFGGVSEKSHIDAARYLWANGKNRTLLALDIKRFFEQISRKRVFYFFYDKADCSQKASNLLADLTCVPKGPKGSKGDKTIGRGFATSTRLSFLCNLDTFMKAFWTVKSELKGHNPRIAVFIDDIGITASDVSEDQMEDLYIKLKDIFENYDYNQSLPLNDSKTKIKFFSEGVEHLGIELAKNNLLVGSHVSEKIKNIREELNSNNLTYSYRKKLTSRLNSLENYKKAVEK